MARIPFGADLVENRVSTAPGFMMENVIVMAGVPAIMQAMLDNVAPRLRSGAKMLVETVEAGAIPEGRYAAGLAEIAGRYPAASIGSYPSFTSGAFRNQIVVRAKDPDILARALGDVRAMIEQLSAAVR